jgi:hypothetical protein
LSARRLIVLAPIEPSPTGNRLAMRTDLFCRSAPTGVEVLTVVVPVAGHVRARTRAHEILRVNADPHLARSGIAELVADGAWRERLGHAGRLP